jgi:hypothetical protein
MCLHFDGFLVCHVSLFEQCYKLFFTVLETRDFFVSHIRANWYTWAVCCGKGIAKVCGSSSTLHNPVSTQERNAQWKKMYSLQNRRKQFKLTDHLFCSLIRCLVVGSSSLLRVVRTYSPILTTYHITLYMVTLNPKPCVQFRGK